MGRECGTGKVRLGSFRRELDVGELAYGMAFRNLDSGGTVTSAAPNHRLDSLGNADIMILSMFTFHISNPYFWRAMRINQEA